LAATVPELTEVAKRVVLVTAHRRENFGKGIQDIISAVRQLATRHSDLLFVWPVHPNPNVRDTVHQELAGLDNVRLLEPLSYNDLLKVLRRAVIALSDSGGIQEEAPSFACPVLVLRDKTERPEAIAAGCNVLVGTDTTKIIETFEQIVGDPDLHRRMTEVQNPYGDGTTSKQIADILLLET
jgi:UDP-N-acetylglucosamine 2-epimerase (non-hydrolysing)